jgi:hypothetical protein
MHVELNAPPTLAVSAPEIACPVMRVRRGPADWAYIYTVLGFAVAYESAILLPRNVVAFCAFAALTAWVFIESGWVHNKLLGFKIRSENKFR